TFFGGGVTLLGLGIVAATQRFRRRRGQPGRVPHVEKIERVRVATDAQGRTPVIAVLHGSTEEVTALVDVAAELSEGAKVLFLFIGAAKYSRAARQLREIVDPYLLDEEAQAAFRAVKSRCGRRVRHRLVYAVGAQDWTAGALDALHHFVGGGRIVLLSEDADDIGAPARQRQPPVDVSGVPVVVWTMAAAQATASDE
ncbi:MAG: hypothetical protein ABI352_12140, partial [Candidatus Dormibacter sp.]